MTSLASIEAADNVSFSREVLPILSNKCFVCHGPDAESKSDLRLDSQEGATTDLGGYRAIDSEHPENSELLKRIFSKDAPMPPADAEKQLTDEERQILKLWIEQGGEYATHWAFVPPTKSLPDDRESDRGQDIIDAFIKEKLKSKRIELAPRADRATLARRAALVLTGLPPEPKQLQAFLDDLKPGAYERYLDQLLESPRYGEHQARYWLDAVRYGDTHGLHLDNKRGIYPYRDWVVQAFNRNLPFDQFITWQLAGDLLPDPTLEQLVATGYVRMNPTTAEGGAIPEEFQAKNNFDRVENLGTVFLGMSLTCARCHSHKYDPVPQAEYYRLLAFFNSTAEHSMDGNKYEYPPIIKAPANLSDWNRWRNLTAEREKLLTEVARQLESNDPLDEKSRAEWKNADDAQRLKLFANKEGPFQQWEGHDRAIQLQQAFTQLEEQYATTLIAQELPKPRETKMLERGEYDRPIGEPLDRGVISILGNLPEDVPRNRLGLARWLTSPDHPLVSRVLINRVWQRVFGAGLVRTPEDFGLQGQQPTHPALLDWLSVEFQECGWDLKQMLKLMLLSETFQQDSRWRDDMKDPENRFWARGPGYRLDAEVIRDVGLWASGLLAEERGGEGIKPYQPAGLWSALMHPASNTKKYERDSGEKLYRRSLYVYWKRTSPHPMMTLFDAPSRESSCVRRSRTNTPLQSLGLLNETQRLEMSRMLAARLIAEKADDPESFNLLFTLLASRPPSDQELKVCVDLLDGMRKRYENSPEDVKNLLSLGEAKPPKELKVTELAAWTQVCNTVLASDLAILLY